MPIGPFDYVKPTQEQTAHMETIRRQCDAILATLKASNGGSDRFVPEFSTAIDRLQEFAMWANKGICRIGL